MRRLLARFVNALEKTPKALLVGDSPKSLYGYKNDFPPKQISIQLTAPQSDWILNLWIEAR
ncbi:MAG: hypothetical protein AAGJ80_06575, partial [Cyanobacteria bacterium J06553_1]